MPQTLQVTLVIVQFLATTAGSGSATTYIFDWLKRRWPYQDGDKGFRTILHAPRYARWFSLVLAMLISLGATAILALLTGENMLNALDLVAAPALSALWSQWLHGLTLPTEPVSHYTTQHLPPTDPSRVFNIAVNNDSVSLAPSLSAEDTEAALERLRNIKD